jgi:tetratricopeptide (TPR) repeat protein
MKKFLFTLLIAACVLSNNIIAQTITTPQQSTAAEVKQTIGISTVIVKYSRPAIKEREVWGKLVKYGYNIQGFGSGNPAPWRAGANENTVLTISHEATIEGKKVPAGSYGLFFVINQDNTGEVILSKNFTSWGSFFFDSTENQIKCPIKITENQFTEYLTYDFINLTKTSCELVLNWDKKQFPVKIEFAVDDIVINNAKNELKNAIGFNALGYASAAQYSFANKTQIDQGLKWVDKSLTLDPTNFNALTLKSRILTYMGKVDEANKLIEETMKTATEVNINNYGYQMIGLGLNDKAIAALKINTERFPLSANAWDSLGEGYAIKGDKENAVKCFKKSLSLNPPANVEDNSEKYLKQLGAL